MFIGRGKMKKSLLHFIKFSMLTAWIAVGVYICLYLLEMNRRSRTKYSQAFPPKMESSNITAFAPGQSQSFSPEIESSNITAFAPEHTQVSSQVMGPTNIAELAPELSQASSPEIEPSTITTLTTEHSQAPSSEIEPTNITVFSPNDAETHHVIFIKVHKAASSTVQNIMLRFSLARNLNVLLPANPNDHLNDFGSSIDPERIIPHPANGLFDILCDHIIFNEDVLAPYFPVTATRVAIVREPMQQALSALAYFTHSFQRPDLMAGLQKFKDAPLEGFLGNPSDFYESSTGVTRSYINNRMSVDLGFDSRDLEASKKSMTKIRMFLDNLEEQFDLILIAEYFDESMVLLRRLLNWGVKDIMYLEVNTANSNLNGFQGSVWNQRPMLNSATSLAFRKWAAIDYALYHHFLTIFLNKIGSELFFFEEVGAYRESRDLVVKFCSDVSKSSVAGNESISVPATNWTEAFSVTEADCHLMSMQETALMAVAIERQKQRLNMTVVEGVI